MDTDINFLRLAAAILKVVPNALLNFFMLKHPNISRDLANSRDELQKLKRSRIINAKQWEIIHPPISVVNPTDFDVTLLCLLLRHLTKVDPPKEGWNKDPQPGDTTTGADVLRIRNCRNYIVHCSSKYRMSNAEFASRWTELCDATLRLGGQSYNTDLQECLRISVEKLHTVQSQVRDPLPRKDVFSKKIREWEDFERSYVKREADSKLRRLMKTENTVTVTGFTGSGKKCLVHHFALKMRRKGYKILDIKTPLEFLDYYKSTERLVFIVDNPCGSFSLNDADFERWSQNTKDIHVCINTSDTKLLFTSKSIVTASKFFKNPPCILNKNILDLDTAELALTTEEKEEMIKVYLPDVSDTSKIVDCEHKSFPLICKLIADEDSQNDALGVFKQLDPFDIYVNEFDRLEKRNPASLSYLILCFVNGNRMDDPFLNESQMIKVNNQIEEILKECPMPFLRSQMVKKELDELLGIFLKQENDSYSFQNLSVYNAFVYWVSNRFNLAFVLRYCSSSFLCGNIRFESTSKTLEKGYVYLKDYHFGEWLNKIISEITDGNLYNVLSSSLVQESLTRIVSRFKQIPSSLVEIMMMDKFSCNVPRVESHFDYMFHIRDAKGKLNRAEISEICSKRMVAFLLRSPEATTFHWFMAYTNVDLCKVIWSKLSKGRKDILQRFPFASLSITTGNTDLLKFALKVLPKKKSRPVFKQNPLLVASFCGHRESVELLIRNGYSVNDSGNTEDITPLHVSAGNGYLDIVKLLFYYGAKINTESIDGTTPLMLAVQHGHADVFDSLMEAEADISLTHEGNTLLMYASIAGKVDVVLRILEKDRDSINMKNELGITALYLAAYYQNHLVVHALLENGADTGITKIDDESSPLHVAAQNGNVEITSALIRYNADVNGLDTFGQTPLFVAAQNNQDKVVQALVNSDALPNTQRKTDNASPMYIAAELGFTEILRILLRSGSDPNTPNDEGNTPFLIAVTNGRIDICKELLSRDNVDVNATNSKGYNPVLMAAKTGNVTVLKEVIDRGADVNSLTSDEQLTPLMIGCILGNEWIVHHLLSSHANITQKSKSGKTCFDFAEQMSHSYVLMLLTVSDLQSELDNSDIVYSKSSSDSVSESRLPNIDSVFLKRSHSRVHSYSDCPFS